MPERLKNLSVGRVFFPGNSTFQSMNKETEGDTQVVVDTNRQVQA